MSEVTDTRYGPQTYQIEKLLERARTLTPDEVEKLDVVWTKALDEARTTILDVAPIAIWITTSNATWYAARNASWYEARNENWDVAQLQVWYEAWRVARTTIWDAVWDATSALLARDLIGETFTQAHYDLLTKPWREVIGEFEEPTKGESDE